MLTFFSGYMAPEYVMHGVLSVKADVFSFGVVVLELISGQKNSSFSMRHPDQTLLEWVKFSWFHCSSSGPVQNFRKNK